MSSRVAGGCWCSAPNCKNSRKKCPHLSFFHFPKDEERSRIWVLNSGRQDLLNKDVMHVHRNYYFCADHFDVEQCMNSKKNKLIWNAIPTLFDIPKPSGRRKRISMPKKTVRFKKRTKPVEVKQKSEEQDEVKKCLYVYCRNNSRNEQKKKFMNGVQFLPIPSAESELKKRILWLKSCGRHDLSKDRSMDLKLFHICSVHFEGGNGPTTEHPDPIPHCLTLKFNSYDGNFVSFVKKNHVPILPSQPVQQFANEPPATQKSSVGGSSEDYEITVIEQYSLSDIRASYPIPTSWIMCFTLNSVFFTRIHELTNCLLVKFTVHEDMTTTVQALCREVSTEHPLFQTFPKTISESKTLDVCFVQLTMWNPCQGNNEKAFISLFLQSENINGFFSPQTGSVHSADCTLLTGMRNARCKQCQMQRVSLRSMLRQVIKINKEFWPDDENNENMEDGDVNFIVEVQP